jgi:hypothetical protein
MHAQPAWQIDLLVTHVQDDNLAYKITIVIGIIFGLLTNKQQMR